jgi:hypothetical protein
MGLQGKKGKKTGKSREDEIQKVREDIAELQRKLKAMLEQRNGNGDGNGGGSDKKAT